MISVEPSSDGLEDEIVRTPEDELKLCIEEDRADVF